MNAIQYWFNKWVQEGLQWLNTRSDAELYLAWQVLGAVLFGLWLVWAIRYMRRAMGYVQFRGTWYSPQQLEALIKIIDEDVKRGHRVMQHDEMALLRKWKFGDTKTVAPRQMGYTK